MGGDASSPRPWFTRRGLLLRATGSTIAVVVACLWLVPGGFLPALVIWSALLCGTGFLAFVVKARRTYASAQLRYPPPLYRPSLLPYLLVFLVLGLGTWVALRSGPPRQRSPRTARSGLVVGDAVVNGVGVVGQPLLDGLVDAPGRAFSGLLGVGFLVVGVFPLLSAHAFGRLGGFSAGVTAARRLPETDDARPQP